MYVHKTQLNALFFMASGSESSEFKTFQLKKMIYTCEVTFVSLFLVLYLQASDLTLRCISKFIPPPWYKEAGLDGNPPRSLDMLQYFETILPFVESL